MLKKGVFVEVGNSDIVELDIIGEEDSTCDSDEVNEVNESFRLESETGGVEARDEENWVPESTERCMITQN